jgi:hypothetical protein
LAAIFFAAISDIGALANDKRSKEKVDKKVPSKKRTETDGEEQDEQQENT